MSADPPDHYGVATNPNLAEILAKVSAMGARSMGSNPARQAQFEQSAQIARDLFRKYLGADPRDHETPLIVGAFIALGNILDLVQRGPIPPAYVDLISKMVDSTMTALALGAGVKMGVAPPVGELHEWAREQIRIAADERATIEGLEDL